MSGDAASLDVRTGLTEPSSCWGSSDEWLGQGAGSPRGNRWPTNEEIPNTMPGYEEKRTGMFTSSTVPQYVRAWHKRTHGGKTKYQNSNSDHLDVIVRW